jgi:hypothetical protein
VRFAAGSPAGLHGHDHARAAQAEALRQERAALWRIAMLCKDALASPSLPPAWRPYFVQIARVCREGIQQGVCLGYV